MCVCVRVRVRACACACALTCVRTGACVCQQHLQKYRIFRVVAQHLVLLCTDNCECTVANTTYFNDRESNILLLSFVRLFVCYVYILPRQVFDRIAARVNQVSNGNVMSLKSEAMHMRDELSDDEMKATADIYIKVRPVERCPPYVSVCLSVGLFALFNLLRTDT